MHFLKELGIFLSVYIGGSALWMLGIYPLYLHRNRIDLDTVHTDDARFAIWAIPILPPLFFASWAVWRFKKLICRHRTTDLGRDGKTKYCINCENAVR